MSDLLHYLSIGIIIAFPALGVSIGESLTNKTAVAMINEQPSAQAILQRIAVISMTLTETALILAVVMGLILVLSSPGASHAGLVYFGIILSIALPGFLVGIFSSFPGRAALRAAARQPLFGPRILQLLLLTQSVVQTPVIFGFIIALILTTYLSTATTPAQAIRLFACGLTFGLGSIGPLIGLSRLTSQALQTTGTNREIFPKLRNFTLISQALAETPVIFALIVSLTMILVTATPFTTAYPVMFILAAFTIGFTTLGTGLSSGKVAATAIYYMGTNPRMQNVLARMSIITQAVVDTSSIWGLIAALLLITR